MAGFKEMFFCMDNLYFTLFYMVIQQITCSMYVPDEYYQSVEVAHRIVFGYGYLTWEWAHGIRSYLYVGFIASVYKILHALNLDSRASMIYVPRMLQALLSGYSLVVFKSMVKSSVGYRGYFNYPMVLHITNWFIIYCSTRTIINTVEMNLTTIGLYYYPWPCQGRRRNPHQYFYLAAIVCLLRPTAAIFWTPLVFYHLYSAIIEQGNPVYPILRKYFNIGLACLTISTIIDSSFHWYLFGKIPGKANLVLTWVNFFYYNIVLDVGSYYSVEPFNWYLVTGLPATLNVFCLPFLFFVHGLIFYPENYTRDVKVLAVATLSNLLFLSFVPHKEFRFLLPLIPVIAILSSQPLDRRSLISKMLNGLESCARDIYSRLFVSAALTNFCIFWYFVTFHQTGTLDVMKYLGRNSTDNVLFLMPCHSTPLYSHVHSNISMRFLRCEPNFEDNMYVDEADMFYRSPETWLENEYPATISLTEMPTHIVMYDELLNDVKTFLSNRRYNVVARLHHTHFPLEDRVGKTIVIATNKGQYGDNSKDIKPPTVRIPVKSEL